MWNNLNYIYSNRFLIKNTTMSTQSKSNPLFIIIIIAVALFISALIYKMNAPDNSEVVNAPLINETNIKPKPNKEIIEDTLDVQPKSLSEEEIIQAREKHTKLMNKHMKFRNADEVMETILKLQEMGKEDLANEYIDFLLMKYPDYKMKDS